MAIRMGRLDRIITTPGIYNRREVMALCHHVSLQVMPDSGAQPTLQVGNAPVAPVVLHKVVDDGNHLPSGDPFVCVVFSIKKKT